MIVEPNSLCTRVLKARYYKEGDFLLASCPKHASYTWRGIVYGRDLLREGLVWRVGGGDQIKVMGDKWIPRSSAQHPLGCKQKECPKMVKDFILPGGGAWNETKLREFFCDDDVTDILCTSVCWNSPTNQSHEVRQIHGDYFYPALIFFSNFM
jgi:hypothetical protein